MAEFNILAAESWALPLLSNLLFVLKEFQFSLANTFLVEINVNPKEEYYNENPQNSSLHLKGSQNHQWAQGLENFCSSGVHWQDTLIVYLKFQIRSPYLALCPVCKIQQTSLRHAGFKARHNHCITNTLASLTDALTPFQMRPESPFPVIITYAADLSHYFSSTASTSLIIMSKQQ